MGPVSCHYRPVSMDDKLSSVLGKQPSWWMVIMLGVVVVILFVPTVIFTVMANREACKDGLLAEQKCRNFTHLLERQLTQAQDVLLEMKIQAATCNQTVVSHCHS